MQAAALFWMIRMTPCNLSVAPRSLMCWSSHRRRLWEVHVSTRERYTRRVQVPLCGFHIPCLEVLHRRRSATADDTCHRESFFHVIVIQFREVICDRQERSLSSRPLPLNPSIASSSPSSRHRPSRLPIANGPRFSPSACASGERVSKSEITPIVPVKANQRRIPGNRPIFICLSFPKVPI